jgi:hypothetical protein
MESISTADEVVAGPSTAETSKRRVEVVTTPVTPVKDIGPARMAGLKLASWLFGSPLTWVMHWAIRVDGTYFELQRSGGLAKPCLRASQWTEERSEISSLSPCTGLPPLPPFRPPFYTKNPDFRVSITPPFIIIITNSFTHKSYIIMQYDMQSSIKYKKC